MSIDMGCGLSIWVTVYRYSYLPYRYGHLPYRCGISFYSASGLPSMPSSSLGCRAFDNKQPTEIGRFRYLACVKRPYRVVGKASALSAGSDLPKSAYDPPAIVEAGDALHEDHSGCGVQVVRWVGEQAGDARHIMIAQEIDER